MCSMREERKWWKWFAEYCNRGGRWCYLWLSERNYIGRDFFVTVEQVILTEDPYELPTLLPSRACDHILQVLSW